MERIQFIVIVINCLFVLCITWLIYRGKLREEYAIFWIVCTLGLIVFSFWRNGIEIMAKYFGVADPPNLLFTGFIFMILVYLLNLSVVNSKQQKDITRLAQELALLKTKLEEKNENATE